MPSKDQHGTKHHRTPLSSPSSKKVKKGTDEEMNLSQTQVVYACIAVLGLVILMSRPFLILIATVLAGYGRLYHVETRERRGHQRLFSGEKETRSERTLHLGPSPERGGAGGGGQGVSLEDLKKTLNLPVLGGVEEKRRKSGLFAH